MPLENAGELDSNRQILELAPYDLSSSASSSDKAGLKELKNIGAAAAGGGGGGNIRAQFLGNVLTMAWTMPARPHQSECFAHRG